MPTAGTRRASLRTTGKERQGRTRQITFRIGRGRHRIWGTALLSADGLSVNLVGGDMPHIGSVAISIPHPSTADPGRVSSTTSIFTIPGRREDAIAQPLATRLARAFNKVAVVVAGVHVNGATSRDFSAVLANCEEAEQRIVSALLRRRGRHTSR